MNPRIKELAVKADLLIKKSNGDEFRYGNFDPKFQKFAELIVRQVFLKIEDERFEIYQPVKESVMKYFGVEE